MSIVDGRFLGEPIEFWKELKNRFEKIDPETSIQRSNLLDEIVNLKGKISFYESRIQEMINVMKEKP